MLHPVVRICRRLAVVAGSAGLLLSGAWAQPGSHRATVTADFGNRATSFHIPGSWLGADAGGTLRTSYAPLLQGAGLGYTRFHADIEGVYSGPTPNWSYIDSEVSAAQAAGMRVILEMDHTPSWLVSSNSCRAGVPSNYAEPDNLSRFAQIAASYVSHMDANFPGVVTDYEIWNEPDGGGLCAGDNSDQAKLSAYLDIYAAVAPALRSAANADGVQIRIGGPALGSPYETAGRWLGALLQDGRTAPYVDFVSYHYYPTGLSQVNNGMTWHGANGTPSLYGMTQRKGTGMADIYQLVSGLVAQGSQPNAGSTPIYFDEYNSDWSFDLDCCRNTQRYAPLFNAVVFADLLNTVYGGAGRVPAKVLYYAVSNPPFCLGGLVNNSMDCSSTASPEAYPQYYAFELFASPSYLGLQNGGHVANSVSSTSKRLLATAFYANSSSNSEDAVIVINPTGKNYSAVNVVAQQSGLSSPGATVYTLDSNDTQIAVEGAQVSPSDSGYQVTVGVPPYSVVAIAFK